MQKVESIEVIVVGGGLAGLVSALHLSKLGVKVLVIEKNSYPKHKVCGEYVSNETLPYLQSIGFSPSTYGAKKIIRFELSSHSGRSIETQLPLGGFSISRYALDFELSKLSQANGVRVIQDTVTDVTFEQDQFTIQTKNNQIFQARVVLGAYGKRSNIDVKLNRTFIQSASPYLAVKAHYKGDFPEDLAALHCFNGGYCGASKVENDHINICYIVDFKSFKRYKNIETFQQKVLTKNKRLKQVLKNASPVLKNRLPLARYHLLQSLW